MTEGLLYRKILEELKRQKAWEALYPEPTNEEMLKVLDEAKKDIFSCLGGYSYDGERKEFVQGISDRTELVLKLKKWFGGGGGAEK